MPLFSSKNKSTHSLEKIQDQARDRSPAQRSRLQQQQLQREGRGQSEPEKYPQQQQGQYSNNGAYRAPQGEHYTIQNQQVPQDERYYQDQAQQQQQQQQQQHLSRSSSLHQPPSVYAEQQQLQAQGPSVRLVNPNLQQESIAEDDQIQPGQTQFGASQRLRTSGPKEEKKSRNSGFVRGLFGGKDKKDSSSESSRLSRHSSVLGSKRPQGPVSPSSIQHPGGSSPKFPPPAQHGQSDTIAAYQNQQFQASQEELREEDHRQPEQYYNRPRPNSQYELPSQQEYRRPSVQYQEDAPEFPAPPQSQQYHQQQSTSIYQQPNISQTYLDRPSEERKDFFPYQGQPTRDRPSAAFEAPQSLRPPSQSSLGPPSPLAGPAQLTPRQSTLNPNPPRYSVQSIQAYQAAQQAANQIQQHTQLQSQSPDLDIETPPQQAQGDSQSVHLQEQDMPNRDRDRQQRDSRMEEQDPRYQVQDPRARMSTATGNEQGRSTPPPRGRDDMQNLDHQTLLQKYEELQAKYSKVKRYYFDREAQVTQLQNVVANQRLSMSKTSLDDAQYANRFERLNGAIQNLAFNIRKDWRRLPNWLAPACNRDACTTGTKEMTAVGRACIARWLYEHIFQTIFHPGIDERLSHDLKNMERALRRSPSILTEEQRDDLLTKVTTWRLTTCESLAEVLNSRASEAQQEAMSRRLTDELCAYLRSLLNDPAPPNLEGYLLPIVSQALSISSNLPLESRDICIEYYYPGALINETFMKLETGMTALTAPGSAPSREEYDESPEEDDTARSITSDTETSNDVEAQIREAARAAAGSSNNTVISTTSKDSKKSKGFFSSGFSGGIVGNKKVPSSTGRGPSQTDLSKEGQKEDEHAWTFDAMVRGQKEGKIRFAVFLAVEVRGKSPKAPENGNGNGEKSLDKAAGAASAGPGVSAGGTSGGVGTGGVNVLVKAPVFGF